LAVIARPLLSILRDRSSRENRHQQPRQMPFSLRSIVLFSALIAASVLSCGLVAAVPVPSDPAEPVVTPDPEFTPAPEDCAVPALLVPGAGALLLPADGSPPLCANNVTGDVKRAIATIAATDARVIETSFTSQRRRFALVPERFPSACIRYAPPSGRETMTLA